MCKRAMAPCDEVVTLPQKTGICWFTALLMAVFYSQHMRSLLLQEKMHTWIVEGDTLSAKRTRKLYEIFREMLTSKHSASVKAEAYKYFEFVTPERILRLLHLAKPKTFGFDPTRQMGYNSIWYIKALLTFLNVRVATGLVHWDEERKGYHVYGKQEDIRRIADIDVIYLVSTKQPQGMTPLHFWKPDEEAGLTISGVEYLVDSNILSSFETDVCAPGHQISGITCEEKRYVYNGWVRATQDAAAPSISLQDAVYPCELMPYDWLHNRNDFCISPKLCGLETGVRLPMCFNFIKGDRLLVLVRKTVHRSSILSVPAERESDGARRDLDCVRKVANLSQLLPAYKFDKSTFDPPRLLKDLPIVAPKIQALLENVGKASLRGKHFVFSELKFGYGAKAAAAAFVAAGYHMAYDSNLRLKSAETLAKTRGKNIALLSSTSLYDKPVTERFKKEVLALFNRRPDNVHGDLLRIIFLDSGFKEGIDLFDVEHVHVLEPQTSAADNTQVVGRATRTCGQKGLRFQPNVGWPLHVYVYDTQLPPDIRELSLMANTLFELWFDNNGFDLRKLRFAAALEAACREVAIDEELTRAVHAATSKQQAGGDASSSVCKTRKSRHFPVPTHVLLSAWLSTEDPFGRLPQGAPPSLYQAVCQLAHSDAGVRARLNDLGNDPGAFAAAYASRIRERASSNLLTPYYRRIILKWLSTHAGRRPSPGPASPPAAGPRLPAAFQRFAWPPLVIENHCKEAKAKATTAPSSSQLQFTPTQEFVRHYFTPTSNVKGMLLYHSVGTGKTCTAIATASTSFEREGYRIVWVTRTTLKNDFWKNMFDQVCHVGLREQTIPKAADARKRMLSKAWSSVPPLSYKQFSNLVDQRNQYYKTLVALNGKDDPLRKTLLIIDEAHKLVASGGGDLAAQERPNFDALRNAIHRSYELSGKNSVRVLLMTATPFTNDPMELIKLLSLLAPREDALPEDFDAFAERFLTPDGRFSDTGKRDFERAVGKNISYLNRASDPRQFAQPVYHPVHVPMSRAQLSGITTTEQLKATKKQLRDQARQKQTTIQERVKTLTQQMRDQKRIRQERLQACTGTAQEKKACKERVNIEYDAVVQPATLAIQSLKKMLPTIRAELKEAAQKSKKLTNTFQNDMSQEVALADGCGFESPSI